MTDCPAQLVFMFNPHFQTVIVPLYESTISGRPDADDNADGESLPTMSQAVSASQAHNQCSAPAADKADIGTKVHMNAIEAHWAICICKEVVKVPIMKLKFDLQTVKGQTKPRDEDAVVQRRQSLMTNPPNRPLSFFFIWQDEGLSDMRLRSTFPMVTRCTPFFRRNRLLVPFNCPFLLIWKSLGNGRCPRGYKPAELQKEYTRAQKASAHYLQFMYSNEAKQETPLEVGD